MYVISIACLENKLFVFEDWSFSLFFAVLSEITTEILHRILGRKYGKIEVKNQFSQNVFSSHIFKIWSIRYVQRHVRHPF